MIGRETPWKGMPVSHWTDSPCLGPGPGNCLPSVFCEEQAGGGPQGWPCVVHASCCWRLSRFICRQACEASSQVPDRKSSLVKEHSGGSEPDMSQGNRQIPAGSGSATPKGCADTTPVGWLREWPCSILWWRGPPRADGSGVRSGDSVGLGQGHVSLEPLGQRSLGTEPPSTDSGR